MPTRTAEHATPAPHPRGGTVVSLLFWGCLFASAILYSVWAHAPRFVEWTELNHKFQSNQAELGGLQSQLRHLQRVADALERNPDFAARVARSELDAVRPGAETIRLPQELGVDPRIPAETNVVPPPELPWYLPELRNAAENEVLRRRLVLLATCLVLVAFVFFNDGTLHLLGSLHSPGSFARRVFARYIRTDAPP
ncbi:MAG: hypothetical protein DWQ34_23370 [Planctomycetota bacterium]|nr:MAG: hypothetical protein DWQ34_23370 [Planctomycetota bacterium]REK24185.1 MAG: hypothetical protein DWQ41_14180 [Planctomycetota bacterium]REK28828.1 MAG: hypothetical protein DWQ45_24335 [Planctomycetota bacterium]